MKNKSESRSQIHQIIAVVVVITFSMQGTTANQNHKSEILIKGYSNSTSGAVAKILKLAHKGSEQVDHTEDIVGEPSFTLKSDPVRVQSDFKTVDISVLNRQRDKENAKKVAIIQEDLQSRIKITEPEMVSKELVEEITEQAIDPEEVMKKQAKVKEDIESRLLFDDGLLGFRQESEREDKLHYPVKRSDDDYYSDEPESQQTRTTTEPPKEESFFSIFESLFGSSDDDSQSKKKEKPEDELFKNTEDANLKENIKTVGSLLKPLKPIDKTESESQAAFSGYQSNVPEYRIVNNFHASQSHKQTYKKPESKPPYQSYFRPTEKPYRQYKPYTTSGYEDYDLEEFMDKGDTTIRVKHVSPLMTTMSAVKYPTTSTTTTTTMTTVRSTSKNPYDNKLKFPSIQKKNDYINRNRYQETKNEATEKVTESVTYRKPEIKTTSEVHRYGRPNHENKDAEIKTQKIQESPNFYNLINLPVRYSTKDTAIPLISTSYANTKIQGMGANKYEKGVSGKYPNHKYDQVSGSSTTKGPSYWATKRTSTERSTTSFRPSPMISKTTTKYIPGSDLDKVDYDDVTVNSTQALGSYGSKSTSEVKTQQPIGQTTTVFYKEMTTRKSDPKTTPEASHHAAAFDYNIRRNDTKEQEKTPEKTSVKPVKDIYEEYEYDTFLDHEQEVSPSGQNYPQSFPKQQQSDLEYKTQLQNTYKPTHPSPLTEPNKPPDVVEYEYYDYDVDPSTTTTTTSTTLRTTAATSSASRYKPKYPSLSKEKIKASGSEKVAVVVPSKDHDFYTMTQQQQLITRSTAVPSTVSTTTTSSTVQMKTSQTTTSESIVTENEIDNQFKKPTPEYYKPNQVYKEPAPVFEDVMDDYTTKQTATTTRKASEKPTTSATTSSTTTTTTTTTTTEAVVKSVTSSGKEESNANIVLIPAKEPIKSNEKFSESDFPSLSVQKTQPKPPVSFHSAHEYTTEFTVGVVHGEKGVAAPGKVSSGHFVASSISTNPYGDDEPFRPIPKPPGMTANFQLVHEDSQRQPSKNSLSFHGSRPIPTPPPLDETEPIHEPHEFIPSPQFHRPPDPKPSLPVRAGADVDYDFEGIQTEPKPGQYVIFSKPQLNPEMNMNQLKKKPEISSPTKPVPNVPQYHEKVNPYWQDSQKHVVFNPSEGQFYQSVGKPSEKLDQGRPVYGNLQNDDHLPLQLVPPRGSQSEKPFEGNFVLPEEKQESTANYPRPHWEKNTKPSFLMNTLSNKNDMVASRHQPMPAQMSPTLIPPSSIPPQRFRRPVQPHMPPMRKNFNEAGTNVKPKPNLPNILPQFRPNTKIGSGSYHRPPGYHGSNRRNGMNRYHEKEHGNFPYHIQHPEKDVTIHKEYEMDSDVIPKFITNRGKFPSDVWNSQGMQKRFGQGPQNIRSDITIVGQNQRILRRHQRTPVTTLQKLKQMPGIKTQKTQISREDNGDSSVPLLPPIYKTYVDQAKPSENVYIVYPARAPQKLHTDDGKVFIVSDTKSKKNYYNLTKPEDMLMGVNKMGNLSDKPKSTFPYGFIKPAERVPIKRKENEENIQKPDEPKEEHGSAQKQKIQSAASIEKDEKIDMMLHMQSNNQWNEVKTPPDSMVSIRNPPKIIRNDHYRFSDFGSATSLDNSEIQLNPPSEYHTSIKDDSAFTLGAVMRTMSEGSRKGQVSSIPLHNDEEVNLPKLNVNERISNGKIVTVSMPLDVKQDSNEKESQYHFQVPFQPSSSLTSNESQPVSQGWSIVKNPDDESGVKEENKTTDTSTNTSFSFENFKPELIGGFKPLFQLPEEPEETKVEEKTTNREERGEGAR